jgi:hypothetical protein
MSVGIRAKKSNQSIQGLVGSSSLQAITTTSTFAGRWRSWGRRHRSGLTLRLVGKSMALDTL